MSDINDNEFDWDDDGDFQPLNPQAQQPQQNQQRPQQNQQRPQQNQQRPQQNQQRPQQGGQRPQGQRPQQRGVVPNPNQQVNRPQPNGHHNYPQGQRPQQGQQRPPMQEQQHQNMQRNYQQGQRPQQNRQRQQQMNQQMQQGNPQMQNIANQQFGDFEGQDLNVNPPKKKGGFGKALVAIIVLAIIGVVAMKYLKKEPLIAQETSYETSGRFAYDTLLESINNFNAEAIDDAVGTEDGDSYIAQEYAYVNGVALREEFITKICGLVAFEYPSSAKLSTTGVEMTDESGNVITEQSFMNNGESVVVTIPDYAKIASDMDSNKDYISNMYVTAGYKPEDYTYNDELTDLLAQYICDSNEIPTTTIELALPIGMGGDGVPNITDDSALDDVLFGSVELRNMCAKFSQICMGYTGFKDEEYETEEEQDNPEWEKWNKLFKKYYKEDNGVFNEDTSKWEPWFLRDAEDNFILDDNGEKIVNYYSVKDENGKDWIEPDKKVMVRVTKVRQVEDPWVEESGISYNWIGTHYLQTEYHGEFSTAFRVGDGSIEHPAGIGTTIITKVLCTDGNYHDVRVALTGYWTDQNAIDYAESFSTKNKGFTTQSVIRMITYEVQVENLENLPITFETSEMTLCDQNSNITARTGTLYGFTETTTIEPGQKVFINDWGASTELEQKYVCWGKSFGRSYSMIYFNILAGTGEIPPYSAYELFTGASSISDTTIGSGESGGNFSPDEPVYEENSDGSSESGVDSTQSEEAPTE